MKHLIATSLILAGAVLLRCGGGSTQSDAGPDVTAADGGACDPSKPFGAPTLVPGIVTADGGASPHRHATLTADETQIIFGMNAQSALYLAERTSRNDTFGAPTALTALNTGFDEDMPSLTGDGLTLYYAEDLSGSGSSQIYTSTRAAPSSTHQ